MERSGRIAPGSGCVLKGLQYLQQSFVPHLHSKRFIILSTSVSAGKRFSVSPNTFRRLAASKILPGEFYPIRIYKHSNNTMLIWPCWQTSQGDPRTQKHENNIVVVVAFLSRTLGLNTIYLKCNNTLTTEQSGRAGGGGEVMLNVLRCQLTY